MVTSICENTLSFTVSFRVKIMSIASRGLKFTGQVNFRILADVEKQGQDAQSNNDKCLEGSKKADKSSKQGENREQTSAEGSATIQR